MSFNKKASLIIYVISIFFISCNGGEMAANKSPLPDIKKVPSIVWKKLAEKKIYFGHQSVGVNIMDGVKDVIKEYPEIIINISDTTDHLDFKTGLFAHSRIGKNRDPKSKIDAFARVINKELGIKADIAALKLCYVDVTARSNANKVFSDYSDSMRKLKKSDPDMTIIHFTVPLKVTKTTWKVWIKKILGKNDIWEYDDNIKRNEYNEELLKRYAGKEPVFDIARIQSTLPDGTRISFKKGDRIYYSLAPEYTYDGGHLNEKGRRIVAEQFMIFLANLMQ